MATKPKLDADLSGEPVDQTDYHSKIGSLMYLTSSRPDIVQAVMTIFKIHWASTTQIPLVLRFCQPLAIFASPCSTLTEYKLADMFTKALPEKGFQYLVRRIGMRCLTPAELEVLTKESA
ncbi:hypothetical protein Tco_1003448 [Tanacetum coccineum]|uniref:Uncharacterized protein n=1 Tax=Tanacetum coccineum TaxID=301880 RepID=A0ABQ5F9H1_9ASTR